LLILDGDVTFNELHRVFINAKPDLAQGVSSLAAHERGDAYTAFDGIRHVRIRVRRAWYDAGLIERLLDPHLLAEIQRSCEEAQLIGESLGVVTASSVLAPLVAPELLVVPCVRRPVCLERGHDGAHLA